MGLAYPPSRKIDCICSFLTTSNSIGSKEIAVSILRAQESQSAMTEGKVLTRILVSAYVYLMQADNLLAIPEQLQGILLYNRECVPT